MRIENFESGFVGKLSVADRLALQSKLTPRLYQDGAMILEVDDETRNLCVLIEGAAVVSQFSHDGKVVMFREVRPGDIFGELSALDGLPRSACVTARGTARVGLLDEDALDGLLAASPGFAKQLMIHLSSQIRRMTERLFDIQTQIVRERLLRYLVRRARDVEPERDTVLLADMPTHFDLASYIGTHREAVTKELGNLTRTGLLVKRGRKLEIPSIHALEEQLTEPL